MENIETYFENIFIENNHSGLLELSDGMLRTEDGCVFRIHKFVLAKNSQYFFALFCGMEKGKNDVTIPGLRGETLSNILTYIYTGKIQVTEENICDLMVASDYLLLDELLSQMKRHLAKNLSAANCLAIFIAAMKIGRQDILRESFRFVELHFEEVVHSRDKDFYDLPIEALKLLISDKNLRIRDESIVWLAIVKWVEADPFYRLPWVDDLLLYLARDDVDEDLASEILGHDIVAKNTFCQKINDIKSHHPTLDNLKVLQQYFRNDLKPILSLYTKRRPINLQFIAYYHAHNSVHIYVTYDENIDLWRKVVEVGFCPECIFSIGDCIYMFGRSADSNHCFNVIKKQWVEFRNFRIPRFYYAVVKLDDLVYVLGGISTFRRDEIYDVEIYDPKADIWYDTTPMLPVTYFAAICLNKCIYVVGNRTSIFGYETIAQVYDPKTEKWDKLPELSVTRLKFALVAYHQKMYVIGGTGGNLEQLKDVERYDPANNSWNSITALPYAYYSPKAIVINDLMLVYDNHMENRGYLKTNPPVQWNADQEIWEDIKESSPMNNLHMYHFFTLADGECLNVISKENKDPTTVFEKSHFS